MAIRHSPAHAVLVRASRRASPLLTGIALLVGLFATPHHAAAAPHAIDELAAPTSVSLPDVHLDVTARLDFPTGVGAEARLFLPYGLLVGVGVSAMPQAFANTIGDVSASFGGDASTQALLRTMLDGLVAVRMRAGVAPAPHLGLELDVHYTVMTGHPTIASSSLTTLVGADISNGFSVATGHVLLHAIGGSIEYALRPVDHVVLRVGLGLSRVIAGHVDLETPQAPAPIADMVEAGERRITAAFVDYGWLPEASVAVGVSF